MAAMSSRLPTNFCKRLNCPHSPVSSSMALRGNVLRIRSNVLTDPFITVSGVRRSCDSEDSSTFRNFSFSDSTFDSAASSERRARCNAPAIRLANASNCKTSAPVKG